MERLTQKSGEMVWMKKGELCLEPCEVMSDCSAGDIRNLLARIVAYEDTGLTPEEVTALQESNQEIKQEALPLLQAKIQDRLVVLPVKIGDKIFRLFNGKIEDLLVSNVIYRAVGGDACKILVECIPFHRVYWREDFGKTVFLSKEKAEEALKEQEG